MRGIQRTFLAVVAAGVLLATLSCASTNIDSGDGADVVLLVQLIPQIPVVQTSLIQDVCFFTAPAPVNITLANEPKSGSLDPTAPYNSIQLQTVTISYEWDDVSLPALAPRVFNIGGTVEVNSTASVAVPPIALGDLNAAYAGHSANMSMVFRGRTVAGDAVSALGLGGVLSVNSCPLCVNTDGDNFCDSADNCPNVFQVDQANNDADSLGNLCDPCPDDPNPLCVGP